MLPYNKVTALKIVLEKCAKQSHLTSGGIPPLNYVPLHEMNSFLGIAPNFNLLYSDIITSINLDGKMPQLKVVMGSKLQRLNEEI